MDKNKIRNILPYAAGGSLGVATLLSGNWFAATIIILLTAVKDEAIITGSYIFIVMLIVVCPGWSWQEKKDRIRVHTAIYIEIIQRNLVKKFLEREVV